MIPLSHNDPLPLFFLFLLGLSLGSFLNVVTWRLPRGLSLFRPGSHCPTCEVPIRAWEKLPLLGYLLLRGRCRHCGDEIPVRYPLGELIGGVCLLVAAQYSDGLASTLLRGVFLLAMVAVVFIDREHGIIPDRITLPGTILGFACAPILGVSWGHSALGILLGAGWLLLVIGIYWLIRHVVGMGGGDVKLAAMLGAWLGWKGVFLALLLASFLGVLWGLGLILRKGVSARDTLPYGVFLGPVAAVLLLLGSSL